MKSLLFPLGALGAVVGIVSLASPATAKAILRRTVAWFDPVPKVEYAASAAAGPAGLTAALAPAAPAVPEWRRADREASRACESGEFAAAATAWTAAASKAPAPEAARLRARADRANVYRLLSEGAPPAAGSDLARDEAEYRRRLDALKAPTAGAWLEVADFAASHGLRRHLAFLYEQAFKRKAAAGSDEVQQRVTRIVKDRRGAGAGAAPKEVLESVIRELPTSEAADIAREETGQSATGISSVGRRGEGGGGLLPEDAGRLAEARRLVQKGDAEYRLAVPGSRDVNVHRRAALDAYVKARDIYEDVDRRSGAQAHQSDVHDLNRNIAELKKDLPIGK